MAATPFKSLVSTVDVPGRAPIVVQDPIIPDIDEDDPEQTTSIIDRVEPGRDIFAGEKMRSLESKQPVEPIRPEEEPKEISSFYRTEIPEVVKEKQPDHVLLPDENAATIPSSGSSSEILVATSSSSSPSSSTTSPLSSPDKQSTTLSSESSISSTTAKQPPIAKRPAGPLDHADVEAERVRQELFPDAAAGGR